jgi:hypothetical protein
VTESHDAAAELQSETRLDRAVTKSHIRSQELLSGVRKTKLIRHISAQAEQEQKTKQIASASPEVQKLMRWRCGGEQQVNGVSAEVAALALSLEQSPDAAALLLTDADAVQRLQVCYYMLCYAMLCYAMLCYAMLCYAMSCNVRHGWTVR